MLILLLKILIVIVLSFLTINLAMFIWRVLTPFARIYYRDVNNHISYFGYIRNSLNSNDAKIFDIGRVVGDKEVGFATNDGMIYAKSNGTFLGSVNLNGEIFDKNNIKIAECDPNGKRSWRYLWLIHRTEVYYIEGLNKQNTGFCTESLRFGMRKTSQINLLTKSAAALVLFEDYIHAEEGQRAELSVGASDLAFLAAILFAIFFSVFSLIMKNYLMFPFLGEMISYVAGMLFIYFLIWWSLFMVKTDFANRNISFSILLNLINRNTGIKMWNYWLTFLAALGLISSIYIHGYLFVPLFLVILIGTVVNWIYVTSAPWDVLEPCSNVWFPQKRETNYEKVKSYGHFQNPSKTVVRKTFTWNINNLNLSEIDKSFELEFYKEDFEDSMPAIRMKNPFYGKDSSGHENWNSAIKDLKKSIQTVLNGADSAIEKTEKICLLKIINSAYHICNKYHLADYELYELLLDFCQEQIVYTLDVDSSPVLNAVEYVRFPIENLYDKEGDCDCKASLAYGLFKLMNVDVKFIILRSKENDTKHAAVLVKKDTGKIRLPNKYIASIPHLPDYVFCEATSSGWQIGDLPEDFNLDSIEVI